LWATSYVARPRGRAAFTFPRRACLEGGHGLSGVAGTEFPKKTDRGSPNGQRCGNNLMRLLLISSTYPPVLGGVQTVVHALARQWVCEGHAVQVVTNRFPRSLPREEVNDQIPISRMLFLAPKLDQLRQGRLDLLLASLYFGPKARYHLVRLMDAFRPDV